MANRPVVCGERGAFCRTPVVDQICQRAVRLEFGDDFGQASPGTGRVAYVDPAETLQLGHSMEAWWTTVLGAMGVETSEIEAAGYGKKGQTMVQVDWAERITVQQSTSQWSPRDFEVADMPYVVLLRGLETEDWNGDP